MSVTQVLLHVAYKAVSQAAEDDSRVAAEMKLAYWDAVAPFVVAVAIIVLGTGAAVLAKARFVADVARFEAEAKANAADQGLTYHPVPDLRPDNLGDYADWMTDAVTILTSIVGAVAALLLITHLDRAPIVVVAVISFAVSFMGLVGVLSAKKIAGWGETGLGWFSRIPLIAIAANVLAGFVAALVR